MKRVSGQTDDGPGSKQWDQAVPRAAWLGSSSWRDIPVFLFLRTAGWGKFVGIKNSSQRCWFCLNRAASRPGGEQPVASEKLAEKGS